MSEVLKIDNLTKHYGSITAVDKLSLSVAQCNVFGILGPNGSGKTTTLSVITGIIRATSGSFTWYGKTLSELDKRRIGALIETPNFYPYLTAEQNLRIVAAIRGIHETDIARVLETTGLWNRRYSKFSTYSLGMKQRLSLASLLLGDPEVLILDEPANGLDPQGIADVRNIILAESQRGKTIIMASHILDEVEKVCTHVVILKKGKAIANGKIHELLHGDDQIVISAENLKELYELLIRSGLTKTIDIKEQTIALTLIEKKTTTDLNKFALENGFILSRIDVRKRSLESQYLELIN